MTRFWSVLGSIIFFVIAPGSIAGLVPWWITGWQMSPAFFGQEGLRLGGVVLTGLGLLSLMNSFARFAWEGLGTPAPIAPPQHLVVTGFYRRVRNPMYVGVVATIFGQALVFASIPVLLYALVVWLMFHLFVLAYEEPTLQGSFGDEYEIYRAHVPRWLPRLTPWRGVN